MPHQELEAAVQRYLAGVATDRDLQLFEEWFQITEHHHYTLSPEQKASIAARLLPRLQSITQPTVRKNRAMLRTMAQRWTSIAAVLMLVMTIVATGYYYRYPLLDIIDPIQQQTITASRFEIKEVTLPDSSKVTLNSGASISYPVRYRGPERNINLQGEAFFDVTHQADKPFTVHTPAIHVQVLGTSFTVTDLATREEAAVTVVTGKVKVDNHVNGNNLAILTPGKQMLLNKQTGAVVTKQSDQTTVPAWTKHVLSFTAIPLPEVLNAIQNRFNIRILIKSSVTDKIFTGKFSQTDTFDDILLALELSTGISHKKLDQQTIEVQ